MCKFNIKNGGRRMDACMEKIVLLIRTTNYIPLACCCGHGKYPMTLVVSNNRGKIFEYFSEVEIPRKAKFYRKDKKGYYFIPEVIKENKS